VKYLVIITAFVISLVFMGLGNPAVAKDCWIGTIAATDICPPPPPIRGKVTSTEKFRKECVWLPFPVGAVGKPIVFFTKTEDARCIGKNWKVDCPDCTEWIRPDRPRGPVNGPAAHAVIALRLHDGMAGVSVPRASYTRIKGDAAWCWMGKSGVYDSHAFNERPF
jgi:hypothetical protein